MTTFKQLGLPPEIIKTLDKAGFTEPSPVQAETIPFLLNSDEDLIALAQTGTGKTAAFGLPVLHKTKAGGKEPTTLILCPTRELCIQITRDLQNFAENLKGVSVTSVYGGQAMNIQINALKRGTDIVVGTPGRIHDLIRRKVLALKNVERVVLDEADEMLDMGFKADLDAILEQTPSSKQVMLFSATISKSVYSIASGYMKKPKEISIGGRNKGADNVTHEYYVTAGRNRFEALKRILSSLPNVYGIVFCRTKRETQEVADKLQQAGYNTESLHGDISQNARTAIMDRFKKGRITLLAATDVAARGIDVNSLTHIINYNLPDQNEVYTHRSGRTGRAQKSGISISILAPSETGRIKQLERMVGKSFEYKKIPSGEEIVTKKLDSFLEEFQNIDTDDSGYEKYFAEAVSKLKNLKKEEIIKKATLLFMRDDIKECKKCGDLNNTFNSEKKTRDNGNKVEIKINIGKKHNLDIKEFFSLINSCGHKERIDIGRIKILPAITIFSVDKQKAEKVVKGLRGKKYKGSAVVAERK
jgi:ATP-dependent RNA helicase DeaD